MRANNNKRNRISRMTRTTFIGNGAGQGGSRRTGIVRFGSSRQYISSGQTTSVTHRISETAVTVPPFTSNSEEDADDFRDNTPNMDNPISPMNSYTTQTEIDYGGFEEEAIMFPQSTHSWLFTQEMISIPFFFAIAIAVLMSFCLILCLINVFEDYESNNPLSVPYNVGPSVRIAQYLAMFIALIMEEEIPTGLYLLRMISKKFLQQKFPNIKFWRFVVSAIIRLVMGYLFLFNTFVVVAQATAVLDIFYDVLALQFLQQLDDIAFNLSKIDVFGRTLKRAALANCFRAEFEKKKFGLRKKMKKYLKGIYFVNLFLLLTGMAWITQSQVHGWYQTESITVTFGDQIWNDAIVKTSSGEWETRPLLFSYFNGVYEKSKETHDGRPVYTERNKFGDGSPFINTVPAEIKYCESEDAWVFTHRDIRKSKEESDESECPWILRSPETSDYNLLEVNKGDWLIWTGNLGQNGHFSAVDNKCNGEVDCNYHGTCDNGKCQCTKGGNFYGLHCEHMQPCSLITAYQGEKVSWSKFKYPPDETLIYYRPIYVYERGLTDEFLAQAGVDKDEDLIYLIYSGSRWMGVLFPGVKRNRPSKEYWLTYVVDYHAFWANTLNINTKFTSDPTTQSSIIGIDFYMLGKQGKEFGPFGQLFPLSDPKGSGLFRCAEAEFEVYTWDVIYFGHTLDFSDDSVGTIAVNYELKIDREYESDLLDKDCGDPITGIDYSVKLVRLPKYETHDDLRMTYSLDKSHLQGSEIWNATSGMIEVCHVVRLVDSSVDSNRTILWEMFRKITEAVEA